MKDIFKDSSYTLVERRLDFLADTINYYSVDPENKRCVLNSGGCKYTPISNSTKGCAIGRFMTKKNQKIADSGSKTAIEYIDSKLIPKWMKELGTEDFLVKIQTLHDFNDYWCYKGLSNEGEKEVENITNFILSN